MHDHPTPPPLPTSRPSSFFAEFLPQLALGLCLFGLGFFAGREHLKRELRGSLETAAAVMFGQWEGESEALANQAEAEARLRAEYGKNWSGVKP